jgi:hypothetical protein
LGLEGLQAACEENEELQAALEGLGRCFARLLAVRQQRFFNMMVGVAASPACRRSGSFLF